MSKLILNLFLLVACAVIINGRGIKSKSVKFQLTTGKIYQPIAVFEARESDFELRQNKKNSTSSASDSFFENLFGVVGGDEDYEDYEDILSSSDQTKPDGLQQEEDDDAPFFVELLIQLGIIDRPTPAAVTPPPPAEPPQSQSHAASVQPEIIPVNSEQQNQTQLTHSTEPIKEPTPDNLTETPIKNTENPETAAVTRRLASGKISKKKNRGIRIFQIRQIFDPSLGSLPSKSTNGRYPQSTNRQHSDGRRSSDQYLMVTPNGYMVPLGNLKTKRNLRLNQKNYNRLR